MRILALLTASVLLAGCASTSGVLKEGRWQGALDTGNGHVQLLLDYEGASALLSIPEQGLLKVPITELEIAPEKITFKLPLGTTLIRFEGDRTKTAASDSETITGHYLQNGMTNSFSLSWSGEIPSEKPFDTMEAAGIDETVTLTRKGATLSGRLRVPFQDSLKWAALIIPGSGPTDGDGNSPLLSAPNNSLLRLANALAEAGIPTLRIDKRGTGLSRSSVQNEADQEFSILIEDAEAWLEKIQKLYPERNIAIIGHSQGSLVGIVAANSVGCEAFISLAGSGFPIATTLETQLKSFGDAAYKAGEAILSELKKGNTVSDIPPFLYSFFRPSVQPFLISYMQFDPGIEFSKAVCPILVMQGERDSQTSIEDARALAASAERGEMVILPNMNHLLRDVRDTLEDKASYGEDRLPLSPSLVPAMLAFLKTVEDR